MHVDEGLYSASRDDYLHRAYNPAASEGRLGLTSDQERLIDVVIHNGARFFEVEAAKGLRRFLGNQVREGVGMPYPLSLRYLQIEVPPAGDPQKR